MPRFQITSALSALHSGAAIAEWRCEQLDLQEITGRALVRLQGPGSNTTFRQRVADLVGVTLPTQPCHSSSAGGMHWLWLNPNEWLLVAPLEKEEQILSTLAPLMNEFVALVTCNTDSRVAIGVEGRVAADLLSKGCTLDLHASAFSAGQCTVTRFADVPVIIHRTSPTAFDLYVDRSLAHYLWDWLVDAASEFRTGTPTHLLMVTE